MKNEKNKYFSNFFEKIIYFFNIREVNKQLKKFG